MSEIPETTIESEEASNDSVDKNIPSNEKQDAKEKKQKGLFWLISIGNNSSQLILLNFFQYFAAAIGVREGLMGFLTAIRNLVGALLQGNFGFLSDKHDRKRFLIIGFFLSFAATTLLIFSYNPIMLIVVASVHAFSFSIIIPVWNAAQGDITEIKGRTTFIGKLSFVGQVVGVVLLLFLTGILYYLDYFKSIILDFEIQYGIVFAICAANLLICAIGTLFLRETRKFDLERKPPRILSAFRNKPFRNFIIVNSIFGVTMAALWPIFPIIQVKIVEMSFYQLTIVAAIYAILFSLGNLLGGRIADKIGRKPVLIFSRIFMFSVSLIYIPAVWLHSWYYVILTNAVSGIGNGIFIVMMNAYSLDLAGEENQGSYSGLAQTSWGIATFMGSFIAGFIAQSITNNFGELTMVLATTIAIAILRVLASIGYFFIKESLPKEKQAIIAKNK
ncbi:MAG: MFS transporter [Asgard group archaeon]|nr:MFS transporter [Asgard group archaeon]